MSSHLNPSINNLSDVALLLLSKKLRKWLNIPANFAKTKIDDDQLILFNGLVDSFSAAVRRQKDKAHHMASDTFRKNTARSALLKWYSENFQPFIWTNKKNITDEDLLAMGWHGRPEPREEIPAPLKIILLTQLRATNDGYVYVRATGAGRTLGKPKDVEGLELYFYYEDPRYNPDVECHPAGRYTNVRQEIRLAFPPTDYGKRVWIRGRWYNLQGYSEYSPIDSIFIQGKQ